MYAFKARLWIVDGLTRDYFSQFNNSLGSSVTKAAGFRLEEWESIPDKDKYFLSDGVCRWILGTPHIHIQ
jgi:hypothetical protein